MAVSDATAVVTLTTRFTLRSQRRHSSSWVYRGQVSGGKLVEIYYRNDPVKYDLDFIWFTQAVYYFYERPN